MQNHMVRSSFSFCNVCLPILVKKKKPENICPANIRKRFPSLPEIILMSLYINIEIIKYLNRKSANLPHRVEDYFKNRNFHNPSVVCNVFAIYSSVCL